MKKQYRLQTKFLFFTTTFILVLILVISIFSRYFVKNQFISYVSQQQQEKLEELVESLSQEFEVPSRSGHSMGGRHGRMRGNNGAMNNIGVKALSEGFILRVLDQEGNVIWDAEQTNRSMCSHVREDITNRMHQYNPREQKGFVTASYPLVQEGVAVGSVEISQYDSYFLSDADSHFLGTLNKILFGVGLAAFFVALLWSIYFVKRISRPIVQSAQVAQQMAGGEYHVRMEEESSTKELQQLMTSVNHLATNLEQQEQLRKKLTADVAHELRTPLTTVSTHIEAMMEGVWSPTPERLQSCYEELQRIASLVMDLEHLAKVESETLQLQRAPTSLQSLIDQSLSSYAYEIEKKKLTIVQPATEVQADVDAKRFHQVVHNLISNAVKYTPEGGTVEIKVTTQECNITFQVCDSGQGIPEEDLPHIFERFYRGDKSRNRTTGGAGIGLAVSKAITEAHGGTISVYSTVGQGTCFVVTLPQEGRYSL